MSNQIYYLSKAWQREMGMAHNWVTAVSNEEMKQIPQRPSGSVVSEIERIKAELQKLQLETELRKQPPKKEPYDAIEFGPFYYCMPPEHLPSVEMQMPKAEAPGPAAPPPPSPNPADEGVFIQMSRAEAEYVLEALGNFQYNGPTSNVYRDIHEQLGCPYPHKYHVVQVTNQHPVSTLIFKKNPNYNG